MDVTWTGGPSSFDGINAGYWRLASREKVTPPFVWEGTIRVHDVMNPPVFGYGWRQGQQATYQPKLNWHPLYPSNQRNIVVGVGNVQTDPTAVGISAEMRDVRPDRPYGVRTGYESRDRHPLPATPVDGEWHRYTWDVPAWNRYRLLWDGQLVADVIEKEPATIDPGEPVSVGLRLDFLHVDIGPSTLTETGTMSVEQRAPSHIRFLTAAQWGRVLNHPLQPENLNDPETFVHHTAGNPYRGWAGERAMRELQRQSHNKGYATVAYDAVVHRASNGTITIMEGRGAGRSAATLDRNEEGEAICLMGFYHPGYSLSEQPTAADVEAIAWGIAWMQEQGWSANPTTILGHRDNPRHPNATSCPGDYLYARLPLIRELVRTINGGTPPPIEGDEPMLVGYVKHAKHGAVYRQWSNGTKTWVSDEEEFAVHAFVSGKTMQQMYASVKTMPNNAWMRATGVIVGPIPPGVDEYGQPT